MKPHRSEWNACVKPRSDPSSRLSAKTLDGSGLTLLCKSLASFIIPFVLRRTRLALAGYRRAGLLRGPFSNRFFFGHQVTDKLQCIIFWQRVDTADLVLMTDSVAILGNRDQFRTERTHDELRWVVLIVGLALNQIRD